MPKRVLGLITNPLPLIGGAQISHALLLRQLAEVAGHTVAVYGQGAHANRLDQGALSIRMFRDLEALHAAIRRWQPDVVISALDESLTGARLTERYGMPHIVCVPSFELTPPSAAERRRWLVAADRHYLAAAERRRIVQSAAVVLANSRFTQTRLRRFGIAASVLYPPVEAPTHLAARSPTAARVVSVAGYRYKGLDIVLALAKAMPAVTFAIAGRAVEMSRAAAGELANIEWLGFREDGDFLDGASAVLVPSQWPEPFGRVAVEAALRGIPVLASRTGGLPEICGPSTVAAFRDPRAWQRALEEVFSEPYRRARGIADNRRRASRFTGLRAAHHLQRLIARVARGRRPQWSVPRVVLAGSDEQSTAFAMVNAEWSTARYRRAPIDLRGLDDAAQIDADLTIQNDWTRPFESWPVPPTGQLVAFRTWDFGPFPKAWVERINALYDDLWVMSHWIREQAIAGGVSPDRVHVVPLGVDPRQFSPRGARWRFPAHHRTVFLFVGALIARKGFDVLLEAFRRAFTDQDDVALVVKANPDDVFYDGVDFRQELDALGRDPGAADVVLIDRFLSKAELAALYRAATVTVLPFRAEGFGLPILESMACGRPVVVPDFGAAKDFCTPETSFLVPARRIRAPIQKRMAFNSLGFEVDVESVDFCEVLPDVLAERLRAIAAMAPAEIAGVGQAARRRALDFTWDDSREAVIRAVARLSRHRVPTRLARDRDDAERQARQLQAARALYFGGTA